MSQNLTKFLLNQHDKNVPPDGLIYIDYQLDLERILNMNEPEQHFSISVIQEMIWTDSSLSWNSQDFGGINNTWVADEQIWLPDIVVLNMISQEDILANKRTSVEILSDGTIFYDNPTICTVLCDLTLTKFPVDTQTCFIRLASWSLTGDKLKLIYDEKYNSLKHYTIHSEWHLEKFNVSMFDYIHDDAPFSELVYTIVISRKPLYYVINLIIPSIIISVISVFGLFATFNASGEREERYTLGLTSILTLAVLALVVSDKVPHSSQGVPLLVRFFIYQMVLIAIGTLLTSLIMKIAQYGVFGKPPPAKWICKLFRLHVIEDSKDKRSGIEMLLEKALS